MIKKQQWWKTCIKAGVSVALVAGLVVGNSALYTNKGVITQFLCGGGYTDNSESSVAARAEGEALAVEVEEEGAVLLKNNGALPLKNNKVNVFGWSGSDAGYVVMGTGSGSGSMNNKVTLLAGLKQAGIEYNQTLANAYASLAWNRINGGSLVIEAHGAQYKDYYGISEVPESFYTDSLMQNARDYSDTAIVVVGRIMGEGNDFSKVQYFSNQAGGGYDANRKMLSLSAREEYMIDLANANFDNVILLVNSSNPLELSVADTNKVDAVLNIGLPGTRGAIGVGNILMGEANPSGHLVDTWAYDLSTAASYVTSGMEGIGTYSEKTQTDSALYVDGYSYTDYRENIYSGYYWYETADKEGFWDSDFAKNKWGISNGYKDVVQYPFGFGLSYTTFNWELKHTNFADGANIDKLDTFTATVRVTNTGSVAGKDVVQMYYSAPYTKGEIEKSAIKLGGFAKTPLIEPGQYADVVVEMKVEEMRSYDCYDANNNGFMGYELEAGDYQISFRSDVHTPKTGMTKNALTLKVAQDIRYENDTTTGTKIENQFTNYVNGTSGASSTVKEPFNPNAHSIDGSDGTVAVQYMTRENFIDTFPAEKLPSRAMGKLYNDMKIIKTPQDPAGLEIPEFGSTKTRWTIKDLAGVDYDDEKWDELISQLSYDRACQMIIDAGYGTIAVNEIGLPRRNEGDGPSGLNTNITGANSLKAVNYPSPTVLAQTWDWYRAYQVGVSVGKEGAAGNVHGWYGPGGNLHRSALGGRNFEYYSEDAFISGVMLAYHVYGAKEQGMVTYIKHIGANEDDFARTGCFKWLTNKPSAKTL